jgi:hypothetical protein
MKIKNTALGVSLLVTAGSASAGLAPAAVPVDSPWMMAGLAVVLAVVAVRLIKGRRK